MKTLSELEIERIIEMAWENRTPFEAILYQFGLKEQEVIQLMRKYLQRKSFERWRRRVSGRTTKHLTLRVKDVNRFRCSRQRSISQNKISKR